MKQPKVSIIIPNWNGFKETFECIESFKKVTYPNYELIVVDNKSDGDDVRKLKEKFSDYIQLIESDRNYGCGGGYNTGIRYALENSHPEYLLVMNNDIIVDHNFLEALVIVAESDQKIGIVGPKIYHYQYRERSDVIWSAGGKIHSWALKIHQQIGENDDDLPKYQITTSVDWISGAVLMFKSCLTKEVGLFNPWYFMGHEDIEFCLKVKKRGYKVIFVPAAKAWHNVGSSVKKVHITYADPAAYYYLIKQCFPTYIYIYHLLLLPAFMTRWGFLYLLKLRNRHALRRFLIDFWRFLLQRPRHSP